MVKSCVSITVWKTRKVHAIYIYAIAYVITNSAENLRFDRESYFHVLVFYGLFYKRNWKHLPPVFPYVLQTLVEVLKNLKLRENTRTTGSCSHFNFSFSQTSTRVSITVYGNTENVFYFLNIMEIDIG